MAPHYLGEAPDERRASLITSGVDDAGPGMGGFQTKSEPAVWTAVEHGTKGQQLIHPVWSLTRQYPHRFGISEAIAGRHRVRGMLAWAISGANRDSNTTLGPGTGAVSQGLFGDENY
jgi:hypothetical protein